MYTDSNGNRIEVKLPALGEGGEGLIYEVIGKKDVVFKEYKDPGLARIKEPKIRYMISNSPIVKSSKQFRQTIIWPLESIFKNGVFIGFLMPFVQGSEEMRWFTNPRIRFKVIGDQWRKFDWVDPKAMFYRLSICFNLSRALHLIHRSGEYMIADLKPDNMMISQKGIVSLVDLDSLQIKGGSQLLYSSEVFTPCYCPPEILKIDLKSEILDNNWCYFCFAITAYEILVGSHPFAGVAVSGDIDLEPEEMVYQGYYAHGKKANGNISAHHNIFYQYPDCVKDLFHQSLEQGLERPFKRPDFKEWYLAFDGAIRELYPSPKIAFSSSDQVVDKGDWVELSWDVENAESVSISVLGSVPNYGEQGVRIQKDTRIILIAKGVIDEVQQTIEVKTHRPPQLEFSADKTVASSGEEVKLSWKVTPDKSVTKVLLNGSRIWWGDDKKVRVKRDTVYQLEVFYKGGSVKRRLTIQISRNPIVEFTATPSKIYSYQRVKLEWEAKNCRNVEIKGYGRFSNKGFLNVFPSVNQRYDLVARGSSKVEKKSVKIQVLKGPEVRFWLDPARVKIGQKTYLNWDVDREVKKVEIEGLGDVSHSGQVEILPYESGKYKLIAIWKRKKIDYVTYIKVST